MEEKLSKVIRSKSQINYNYVTIRITQSRIDKGLIAVPVALSKLFPDHNSTVQIYLNDSPISQNKYYSSYDSSTRECRIGGMRQWFEQNNIKSGDEIVIQIINKDRFIYRLIPEKNFVVKTKELEHGFDKSDTEPEALEKIETLSQWTNLNKNEVILSEYYRLTNVEPMKIRKYIEKPSTRAKESVPANLRTILENIYNGNCQICNFWFLKKDNKPYFEIHHLDSLMSHHPKNLIVVCGNCHNQFEYADVKHIFNEEQWLVMVHFNRKRYSVNQAILKAKKEDFFKELFT